MSTIDITGCDLELLVKTAYDLSKPQGLMLHYVPGPLDDEMVQSILREYADHNRIAVRMDYVRGRAVKLTVWKRRQLDGSPDKLFISGVWFDHTSEQLDELLSKLKTPQ